MRKKCKDCGKEFDANESHHNYCRDCYPKRQSAASDSSGKIKASGPFGVKPQNRNPERHGGGPQQKVQLPEDCVFKTFYEEGQLKRGIYLESAQKVADICGREGLTSSQLRQLFFMLKSAQQHLKAQPDIPFAQVRQALYEFARHVNYQVNRGVLKSPTFAALVQKHLDLAAKDAQEFTGFVEYITSIVAYLKQK